MLIPPTAYLYDRQVSSDIYAPYASGKRAFSAQTALPRNSSGQARLPRVLRETTSFLLLGNNIETEGLFRIPPNSRLKDILKEAYDRGQKYIVWKEGNTTLPLPSYPDAHGSVSAVTAIEPNDAYGVHLAASLIKAWYADLRHPLFPRTSYADIRKLFGDRDTQHSIERLAELISPQSGFPMLPAQSREIITRHLLPLLSEVSSHEEHNKMNAENLAVCFAPALLCGEDPMEDAKMSTIIRSILIAATEQWRKGLREICQVEDQDFIADLQPPAKIEEYEDPLNDGRAISGSAAYYEAQKQASGIILEDRDPVTEEEEEGPPLPPRPAPPYKPDHLTGWTDSTSAQRTAPRMSIPPPRYSTVIAQDVEDFQESPTGTNAESAAIADGFRSSHNNSGASASDGARQYADQPQISMPKRKPIIDLSTETGTTYGQATSRSASETRSMSATLAGQAADFFRRKPVTSVASPTQASPASAISEPILRQTDGLTEDGASATDTGAEQQSDGGKFRKPSWPASSRPTGLARPIVPSGGSAASASPPEGSSLTTPVGARRTPSPSLLERMSSFEGTSSKRSELRPPQRLNLKKASVDDLRKLYEERVGTAKTLVEAGSGRQGSQPALSPGEHALGRAATS